MSSNRDHVEDVLRIAIADDHAVVRSGYRRLLEMEPSLQVIAEFADGEAAYRWLQHNALDVLIMDISMPGRGGLETIRRIRARGLSLPVLVFSMHDGQDIVRQCLQIGATGYVTKSSPPEALVAAVKQVAQGQQVLSEDVAQTAQTTSQETSHDKNLSPREFEIFRLLAQGEDVADIARRLSLSEKTVFNYQTAIRQKTGLNTILDMHRYASSQRLIVA